MRCTIVPKVEVIIKSFGDDPLKFINWKTDILGEHRETEVVVAQEFHVKIRGTTAQTRLESQSN